MPSLREDQQPDALIDLDHHSSQRASTDEIVLVDAGLPVPAPEPVFAHEPIELDTSGTTRRKRRVAELEEMVSANAATAREARALAREQWQHQEEAVTGWRSALAELAALREELKGFAAARADLVARERTRAEQTARTDVAAELRRLETERDDLRGELDHLRVTLADQQSVHADNTHRLRDEQHRRAAAEKEAKRAIAAYETAERRLEAAGEALHRSAADEQARIAAVEAERAAAVAELDALGGGGRLTELSNRVEDLVTQLAELDGEVVEMRSRAETAEEQLVLASTNQVATRKEAEKSRTEAARARQRLGKLTRERDALRVKTASLEKVGQQLQDRAADARSRAEAAETERDAAMAAQGDLIASLAERDVEITCERELLMGRSASLEAALVSARADADALRHETAALAAQLEEAWAQAEEARRLAAAHEVEPGETAGPPADGDEILLDALTELAADPVDDDEPLDPDVRFEPPPPDPEDPDARRAALGFLNSLASDLPASRRTPS